MRPSVRTLRRQLICLGAALALGAGTAHAAPTIHSPLPGFPHVRGVIPVRGSTPGIEARDRAIEADLRKLPKSSSIDPTPNCTEASTNPGANLCWWGGPVVGEYSAHLIFWQGTSPLPKEVESFIHEYQARIEAYFRNVAGDDGTSSSTYSVAAQYGDGAGPGTYELTSVDSYLDTADPLPQSGKEGEARCTDSAAAKSVCITDTDLHEEVEKAREANPGWEAGLKSIYFVFTPPNAGGCFEPGSDKAGDSCAFSEYGEGYCAYHSDVEDSAKEPVLYADIPDGSSIEGCDSFEYPEGVGNVDAVLDSTSHENIETITDPLGNGWLDLIGQEAADKCLPPETFEVYGEPLGGTPATESSPKEITPGTLFNEVIGGQGYWLQTVWSNSGGEFQGACEQRMVNAAFAPPSGARATVAATFSGAPSGSLGDPVDYWVWDFGDGMQVGTPEATAAHTYAEPGEYRVTLTAVDEQGNTNTVTHTVVVGAAPEPTPPPVPPAPTTTTVTVTNTVTVPVTAPAKSAAIPRCPSSSPRASRGCRATRRPAATRTRPRRCGSRATSRRGRRCPRSRTRSRARSRR
jgi:hypothetical protein